MDYLLDKYVFDILPIYISPETRKSVGQRALTVVQWADWLCKYESPWKVLQNNPYLLCVDILFVFLSFLTLMHAYRHGGRHLYVWIGITIYALNVELLSLSVPDLNLLWHAQGVLSFFGMRVPLYAILGIHHMIGYTAYVLASRMRLPWWAEGPAAGLCSVMLFLPYRIVGTKLLWWTWHDTDPTIRDRMFWVPWSMIYFHAACICSFVWIMRLSRHLLLEKEYDWTKFPREFICSLLAGSLSFWLGSVQFSLLYYPLHDFFKVHSEITTILFLSLYAILVFSADRNNRDVEARSCSRFWFDELSCAVALEYIFLMVVIATSDPLNIVSEGLHQPIGPCSQMEDVSTPAGLVLQRAKYLCAKKYDEGYFDFHCVPNGPPKQQDDGSGNLLPLEYYAICGTDFENRAEYITVIWGSCILFASFLYQMAACSGFTPIDPVKVRSSVFTQFGALETPVAPNATAELPEIMGGTMTKKPTLRKRTSEVPVSTRVLRSRSHLQ
ncbi:hypothetical protein Q1695_009064 [Nippostrongylus brasiliensis]|nr:hypothetical protein Q1695_009064 [Nippostrongylus brasiliensis]